VGSEVIVQNLIIALVAVDGGFSFGSNCANFDVYSMSCFLVVFNTMVVSARAVVVLSSTPKMAAGETKPKI